MKTIKQIRGKWRDPMFVEVALAWAFVTFSLVLIIKTW